MAVEGLMSGIVGTGDLYSIVDTTIDLFDVLDTDGVLRWTLEIGNDDNRSPAQHGSNALTRELERLLLRHMPAQ